MKILLATVAFLVLGKIAVQAQNISGTFYTILQHLNYTTFLELAGKIDIDTTLMDTFENLTVFAPSDDAFKRLPTSIQQQLHNDLDFLIQVMTFHFYQGVLSLEVDNSLCRSLADIQARVDVYPKGKSQVITVSGVQVDAARASTARNGVLHPVDKVLFPLPTLSALQLVNTDNFNTLLLALSKARKTSLLTEDHVTLLAPSDAAFQRLPVGKLSQLLQNITLLTEVLETHVTQGVWYSAYFTAAGGRSLKTLAGNELSVTVTGSSVRIGDRAEVTQADISVSNGVVHVISEVLLAPAVWETLNDLSTPEFRVV